MSSNPGDTGQTVGFSFECYYDTPDKTDCKYEPSGGTRTCMIEPGYI